MRVCECLSVCVEAGGYSSVGLQNSGVGEIALLLGTGGMGEGEGINVAALAFVVGGSLEFSRFNSGDIRILVGPFLSFREERPGISISNESSRFFAGCTCSFASTPATSTCEFCFGFSATIPMDGGSLCLGKAQMYASEVSTALVLARSQTRSSGWSATRGEKTSIEPIFGTPQNSLIEEGRGTRSLGFEAEQLYMQGRLRLMLQHLCFAACNPWLLVDIMLNRAAWSNRASLLYPFFNESFCRVAVRLHVRARPFLYTAVVYLSLCYSFCLVPGPGSFGDCSPRRDGFISLQICHISER